MNHPLSPQVGMRYSFVYRSQPEEIPGKGWATPKFMPGAFNARLGKVIPFRLEDRIIGHCRVVAAEVAQDGYSVEFTYEITDLDLDQAGENLAPPQSSARTMSFAFREPDPEDQPRDPLAPARLRINWRDHPDQED